MSDKKLIEPESLSNRYELIDTIRIAVRNSNIPVLLDMTSSFDIARYNNDTEVMELYRQAINLLSE